MSPLSIGIGIVGAVFCLITAFVVGFEGGLLLFVIVGLMGISSELVLRREFFQSAYERKSKELRNPKPTKPAWDDEQPPLDTNLQTKVVNEVISLNNKSERYSKFLLFTISLSACLTVVFLGTQVLPWSVVGFFELCALAWSFKEYVEVKLDNTRRRENETRLNPYRARSSSRSSDF